MGIVYSDIPQSFKEKMTGEFTFNFAGASQISEHIYEGFGGEGCAKTAPQGARTTGNLAGYLLCVD